MKKQRVELTYLDAAMVINLLLSQNTRIKNYRRIAQEMSRQMLEGLDVNTDGSEVR